MTFNTLISFSLLALVVTARPLLPETNEIPEVYVIVFHSYTVDYRSSFSI